jgi:patatin-like phospholipase/acyl hydrolase
MTPNSVPFARFQILALDGGGMKALFTAHVLARLEEDLGIDIRDGFDLIAGTSAGGIIALALGAGLRPAEIVDHYEQLVGAAFPPARRRWWRAPWRAVRPTYDPAPLRAALGSRLLGDSDRRLVVTSWDPEHGRVHLFKTPHHVRFVRDWKIPMVDVAMATSAAPIYLPAADVDGQRLIDGGVWANNPSVVAVVEAIGALRVPLQAIRVLNVGTTEEVPDHPSKLHSGGLLTWAPHVTHLVLSANSRGSQGMAQHLVGRDSYWRFDAHVAKGTYRLDVADTRKLASTAATESRRLSPTFAEHFAGHTAAPYMPLHPADRKNAA